MQTQRVAVWNEGMFEIFVRIVHGYTLHNVLRSSRSCLLIIVLAFCAAA